MFKWLKDRIAANPNIVVTGDGVTKTHDVEAKFRGEDAGQSRYYGKLKQSRWSDGQERFKLRLTGLPGDHNGKLRLRLDGEQVSEFEVSGNGCEFRWKGISSADIPQFEIGSRVSVEVGSLTLGAVVEAD